MNKCLLVFITLLTSACSGITTPLNLEKMSAEQIKAAANDRSSVGTCSQVVGPWGTARIVYVQLDKGVSHDGEIIVNNECTVTLKSNGKKP
jgi:hypothetical protein